MTDRIRSCVGGAWVTKGRGAPPPPPPPPPPTNRFPGDPGVGKVYTGTEESGDGRDFLYSNTGVRMLLTHHYFTNSIFSGSSPTFWSRSAIQSDYNSGYISLATFKLGSDGNAQSNAAAILAGTYDSIFVAEANWAKQFGHVFFAAFYHEPEDNWNTGTSTSDSLAANYRAITRHIIQIFRNQGATNVVWLGAIYQTPWSFSSGGQNKWGPWYKFHADWKGTISGAGGHPNASDFYSGANAMVQVMGYDCYDPNIGGDTYHEFNGPIDTAVSKMASDGYTSPPPFIVPEWGTSAGKSTTGVLKQMPSDGWTGFYTRAFRYMRDNNGLGFNIYTLGTTSFVSGSDRANRLAGLAAAVATESSYLVSTMPSGW